MIWDKYKINIYKKLTKIKIYIINSINYINNNIKTQQNKIYNLKKNVK